MIQTHISGVQETRINDKDPAKPKPYSVVNVTRVVKIDDLFSWSADNPCATVAELLQNVR